MKKWNDVIDGGGGTDTAIYSGNLNQYNITKNKKTGWYTIKDLVANRDGEDKVIGVESFNFKGKLIDANQVLLPTIESTGSISLLKDSSGYVYAKGLLMALCIPSTTVLALLAGVALLLQWLRSLC